MKETKNKALSNKELSNVSGGVSPRGNKTKCPNCQTYYSTHELAVATQSGCSTKLVCYRCPGCGHEWK